MSIIQVNITGHISNEHVNQVRSAIAQLNCDTGLILELTIDSHGGIPAYAIEIFDNLTNYRHRTTCIVKNYCYSAALILYLSGDTRIASDNAKFMTHLTKQPIDGLYGWLGQYASNGSITMSIPAINVLLGVLETCKADLEATEARTHDILHSRTKLTDKQLDDRKSVDKNQFFTTTDALTLGIVTRY
jgi:ATP-dependent protease ClpP protease subunit